MLEKSLKSIDYISALRIIERIKIYSKNGITNNNFAEYENWVKTRGVVTENEIISMLNVQNITPEEFNNALKNLDDNEKKIVSIAIDKSDWYILFKEIINNYEMNISNITFNKETLDFGACVLPFILYCSGKLYNEIEKVRKLKISAKVMQSMLEKITGLLVNLAIKTLVWEFRSNTNSKKLDSQNDDICLKEYLFSNFTKADDFIKFFQKYPVIARRITIKSKELINNFSNLIKRVDNHFDELCEILGGQKILTWEDIDAEQGDTHEQGKFVVKLIFDCGIIIYKPRNLEIQKVFNNFMTNISRELEIVPLYSYKAIYYKNYTFETYVEYRECKTEKEVKRFYQRFGQLCACVYMLRGNDIHYENIIACGEYPVLIDVETLFQHQTDAIILEESAASEVYKESIHSVGGSAMIPIVAFSKGKSGKGIDISALGGREQELPYKVLQLVDGNTDRAHFEYTNIKMEAANNVPILNGKKVDFQKYVKEVIRGFGVTMHFFLNNKEKIIAEKGFLKDFKGIKIRHLMKATQNYAKMMDFSSHPNYGKDMAKLERMFTNIWNYPYIDKRIIVNEIDDMLFGDIPIFYGITDEKDIITSTGETIRNYFKESSYDKVKNRIENLDQHEIVKQISQMKVCMGLFIDENVKRTTYLSKNQYYSELKIWKEIEWIADKIVENARTDKNSNTIEWNNVLFDNINLCWKTRGIGCGFVYGSAGILLFLHLANKYIAKYDDIIITILNSIVNMPNDRLPISLNDGLAANLYALTIIYKDNRDESIKAMIYYLANIIFEKLNTCEDISIMYGLSGIAMVMCNAWIITKDYWFEKMTIKIVEKILKTDVSYSDETFYSGINGVCYALNYIIDKGCDINKGHIFKYIGGG